MPAGGNIKTLAGKVAAVLRRSRDDEVPISMKATGTNAVNQTSKCLHVARRYLREYPTLSNATSLAFRVNHVRGEDKDRISQLVFGVSATDQCSFKGEEEVEQEGGEESIEEVWARALGPVRLIGGNIARAIRVAKKAKVVAIGPRAVGRAIVGMTWARRVLHKQGMDMIAIPHMTQITLKDQSKKFVGFHFYVVRAEQQNLEWLDAAEAFDDDTETSVIEKFDEDSIEE